MSEVVKEERKKKKKKSVTAAAEFAGARCVVSRTSYVKIECVLTYTFLSLPVLYSDSSSTGPPATLNGPPDDSQLPPAVIGRSGAAAQREAGTNVMERKEPRKTVDS